MTSIQNNSNLNPQHDSQPEALTQTKKYPLLLVNVKSPSVKKCIVNAIKEDFLAQKPVNAYSAKIQKIPKNEKKYLNKKLRQSDANARSLSATKNLASVKNKVFNVGKIANVKQAVEMGTNNDIL